MGIRDDQRVEKVVSRLVPRLTDGPDGVKRVTAYLRTLRDIADVSRLTAELRRGGWSLEVIEAAWARLLAQDQRPDESRQRPPTRSARRLALGIALVVGLLVLSYWLASLGPEPPWWSTSP